MNTKSLRYILEGGNSDRQAERIETILSCVKDYTELNGGGLIGGIGKFSSEDARWGRAYHCYDTTALIEIYELQFTHPQGYGVDVNIASENCLDEMVKEIVTKLVGKIGIEPEVIKPEEIQENYAPLDKNFSMNDFKGGRHPLKKDNGFVHPYRKD